MDSLSRLSKPSSRWTTHCRSACDGNGRRTTDCWNSEAKNLTELSSLGHFLKGSSATLGLTKVKDSCEKIQHYGQLKDEAGTEDILDKDKCLSLIKDTLKAVKIEYAEVEKVLKRFYES